MQPQIAASLDDELYWQAVLNRDEKSDGVFFYGVLSTRIFCRPSCPSRRPQRERVRFFASPESAVEAGFRACKRCRPEQFLTTQTARVRHACRVIEKNLDASTSPEELGEELGVSASHFQRAFKQVTGITPKEYADALRLDKLKETLHDGASVTSALYDAGYGSSRALYERAPLQLGMTPATYRRGGQGAQIDFSVAPCFLGFLLVAATQKGICSVALGDSPAELEAALRLEFPLAEVRCDEEKLQHWVESVLRFLKGREPHHDLPLDVRATAFQRRVWQALCAIGVGETRTYSQVAQSIGQPTAARAVARACATNPVALLVPCHRVVREGGSLAGYRWGVARKQTLLAHEKES